MEPKEIRVTIDRWIIANEQYQKANTKLEELAKEILNYVKNNYSILLASFAQGFSIYLNNVEVVNKKLYISYTDNWDDCPEYASLDIPIDEVCCYEKYFEKLHNDYLEDQTEKERIKNEFLEKEEYQTYLQLKQKFEK